ncbi:MAG: hypothetical protein HDR01_03120 [Lachnospiraceae bacterium]|nr:hypothetical protein [Lachnospiraceae bacterium]
MSGTGDAMLKDDNIFIDKNSYEKIWEVVINPTIQDYQNRYSEIVVSYNAKEAIWQEYVNLNRHVKLTYMRDAGGKLDRHKVCACYMYAIIKANVLSCRLADSDTEQSYLALNENLAITVGMSVLRAFVLSSINCNEELSEATKASLGKRVDDGIIFPDCNHGDYRNNFASELHYTKKENNYNVLSLANILFLLEIHTLQTEAVHKQGKNKNATNKKKSKRK